MCFPVLFFFSLGFFQKGIEETVRGHDDVLPEWSGWVNLFYRGMLTFFIIIIYLLPGVALCLPIPWLLKNFFLNQEITTFLFIFLLLCLLLVYLFFAKFFLLLALLRFSLTRKFFKAFAITDFLKYIKKAQLLYIKAVMYIILVLIVMQVGSLIVVTLIITIPYGGMVIAHIIGQMISGVSDVGR